MLFLHNIGQNLPQECKSKVPEDTDEDIQDIPKLQHVEMRRMLRGSVCCVSADADMANTNEVSLEENHMKRCYGGRKKEIQQYPIYQKSMTNDGPQWNNSSGTKSWSIKISTMSNTKTTKRATKIVDHDNSGGLNTAPTRLHFEFPVAYRMKESTASTTNASTSNLAGRQVETRRRMPSRNHPQVENEVGTMYDSGVR